MINWSILMRKLLSKARISWIDSCQVDSRTNWIAKIRPQLSILYLWGCFTGALRILSYRITVAQKIPLKPLKMPSRSMKRICWRLSQSFFVIGLVNQKAPVLWNLMINLKQTKVHLLLDLQIKFIWQTIWSQKINAMTLVQAFMSLHAQVVNQIKMIIMRRK